jgi:hypothetical protein
VESIVCNFHSECNPKEIESADHELIKKTISMQSQPKDKLLCLIMRLYHHTEPISRRLFRRGGVCSLGNGVSVARRWCLSSDMRNESELSVCLKCNIVKLRALLSRIMLAIYRTSLALTASLMSEIWNTGQSQAHNGQWTCCKSYCQADVCHNKI